MGNAESQLATTKRSKKGGKKGGKAPAIVSTKSKKGAAAKAGSKTEKSSAKNNKKSKKGKKGKKNQSSSEEEDDSDNESEENESGVEDSGDDEISLGNSEAPSSFLGDESENEVDDEDDSGMGGMAGKPLSLKEGLMLSYGVHSVDIAATVGNAYLHRYKLNPGQKIDFDEKKHSSLFEEVQQWFPFADSPAGSALLTSRIVSWILREPETKLVALGGTVGADENGNLIVDKITNDYNFSNALKQKNIAATSATISLSSIENKAHPTVVTKSTLSGSAFKMSDFKATNAASQIDGAHLVYLSGFFIANSPETALEIARHATEKGKIVVLTFSAPYICQFNKNTILQILQFVDYVFATEEQLLTFCREANYCKSADEEELDACAQAVARMPKVNSARKRIVVAQSGNTACLVGRGYNKTRYFMGTTETLQDPSNLKGQDAFDAFVGGFLSQVLQNMPLEEAIEIGYRVANILVTEGMPDFSCNFGKIEVEQEDEEEEEQEAEQEGEEQEEAEEGSDQEGSEQDESEESEESEEGSDEEGSDQESDEEGSEQEESEEDASEESAEASEESGEESGEEESEEEESSEEESESESE